MRSRTIASSGSTCRAILNTAALFVPRSEREEWLSEWTSELWYLSHGRNPEPSYSAHVSPARFCLGAFRDAMWLRRNHPSTTPGDWLRSPISCTLILAALAVLTIALFGSVSKLPYTGRPFLLGQLLTLGTSLLLVRISAPSPVADYVMPPPSLIRTAGLHWWLFFFAKSVLVLVIVFCGTVDLGIIIAPGGMLPHATLVSYVLGFRWALIDQRRRCRVCLRLLTNPVRIGEASHTMLAWYGTELMCSKGHGLLHVPEIPSSYSTQHWLHLDHSWRDLFSSKTGRAPVFD